jgi:hypothetical protein
MYYSSFMGLSNLPESVLSSSLGPETEKTSEHPEQLGFTEQLRDYNPVIEMGEHAPGNIKVC